MTDTYTVTLDNNAVGKVTVEEQGLYYRFRCRCRLPENQRVSLLADGEDLGILVPENGLFGLMTKLPKKRFTKGAITFQLVRRDVHQDSVLIPVRADTAFPWMDRLDEASFTVTPDGPAIRFPVL